jgi:outer membrane immunogenic protein
MTRFILTACAVLISAVFAVPAFAADLPAPSYRGPAYKGPVYVGPGFSWTGFYVGINGGYGFGKSNWANTALSTGDFDINGPLVGGTIGYNLQTGAWVWGAELDADYSWIKGSTTTTCPTGCETRNAWLATGRARIGYAWDRFLPYITGGAAYGSVKMTAGTLPDESKSKFGWTAGAGVEYAFLGAWTAKLEYLYVDLGKVSCDVTTCGGGAPSDVKFTTSLVRVGLNYRFW